MRIASGSDRSARQPAVLILHEAVETALGERKLVAFRERVAATVGTACVLLYGGSTLVVGTMRQKEDWRGAYAYLAEHASAADIIAVCPIYNYPSLRYHATAPVATMVLAVDREGSAGGGRRGAWRKPGLGQGILPWCPRPSYGRSARGGPFKASRLQYHEMQLTRHMQPTARTTGTRPCTRNPGALRISWRATWSANDLGEGGQPHSS
jgi:hypothetical protein